MTDKINSKHILNIDTLKKASQVETTTNNAGVNKSIFEYIDKDKDGILSDSEISLFKNIDKDRDGEISKEEFKAIFGENTLTFTTEKGKVQKVTRKEIQEYLNTLISNNKTFKEANGIKNLTTEVKNDINYIIIEFEDGSVLQINSLTNEYSITTKNAETSTTEYYDAANNLQIIEEVKGTQKKEYIVDQNNNKIHTKTEITDKHNPELSKTTYYQYEDSMVIATTVGPNYTKVFTKDKDGKIVYEKETNQNTDIVTETSYNHDDEIKSVTVTNGDKKTTTIQDFDDNKLEEIVFENGKKYTAKYDGQGNTYVVVQFGETLTSTFNIKGEDLKKLKEINPHRYYNEPWTKSGELVKIPGIYSATDPKIANRGSKVQAENDWRKYEQSVMDAYGFNDFVQYDKYLIDKKCETYEDVAKATFAFEQSRNDEYVREWIAKFLQRKEANGFVADGYEKKLLETIESTGLDNILPALKDKLGIADYKEFYELCPKIEDAEEYIQREIVSNAEDVIEFHFNPAGGMRSDTVADQLEFELRRQGFDPSYINDRVAKLRMGEEMYKTVQRPKKESEKSYDMQIATIIEYARLAAGEDFVISPTLLNKRTEQIKSTLQAQKIQEKDLATCKNVSLLITYPGYQYLRDKETYTDYLNSKETYNKLRAAHQNALQEGRDIHDELLNYYVNNSHSSEDSEVHKILNKINPQNVVFFFKAAEEDGYQILSQIVHEGTWLNNLSKENTYILSSKLIGNLETAAKQAGVNENIFINSRPNYKNEIEIGTYASWLMGLIAVQQQRLANSSAEYTEISDAEAQEMLIKAYQENLNTSRQALGEIADEYCWVTKGINQLFATKGLGYCDIRNKINNNTKAFNELKTAAANGNKAIFNAKYREIFGIDYDKKNMIAVDIATINYQMAYSLDETEKNLNKLKNSIDPNLNNISYDDAKEKVRTTLNFTEDQLNILLSEFTKDKINSPDFNDAKKLEELNRFIDTIICHTKSELNDILGGKTLDEFEQDINDCYTAAYGPSGDNIPYVQYLQNSMATTSAIVTAVVEIGLSIALMFVPGAAAIGLAKLGTLAARAPQLARVASFLMKSGQCLQKANQLRSSNSLLTRVTANATFGAASDATTQLIVRGEIDYGRSLKSGMFSGLGVLNNTFANKIFSQSDSIRTKIVQELTESGLNLAESVVVETALGGKYGLGDMALDVTMDMAFATISGSFSQKSFDSKSKVEDIIDPDTKTIIGKREYKTVDGIQIITNRSLDGRTINVCKIKKDNTFVIEDANGVKTADGKYNENGKLVEINAHKEIEGREVVVKFDGNGNFDGASATVKNTEIPTVPVPTAPAKTTTATAPAKTTTPTAPANPKPQGDNASSPKVTSAGNDGTGIPDATPTAAKGQNLNNGRNTGSGNNKHNSETVNDVETELSNFAQTLEEGDVVFTEIKGHGKFMITKLAGDKFNYKMVKKYSSNTNITIPNKVYSAKNKNEFINAISEIIPDENLTKTLNNLSEQDVVILKDAFNSIYPQGVEHQFGFNDFNNFVDLLQKRASNKNTTISEELKLIDKILKTPRNKNDILIAGEIDIRIPTNDKSLDIIERLLKLKETCDNPLLNIDNIILFSYELRDITDIEFLVNRLEAKNPDGSYKYGVTDFDSKYDVDPTLLEARKNKQMQAFANDPTISKELEEFLKDANSRETMDFEDVAAFGDRKEILNYLRERNPKTILSDIKDGLDNITDPKLKRMFNETINKIQNSNLTKQELTEKLKEQRQLVDAYNNLMGNYTGVDSKYWKEYLDYLEKHDAELQKFLRGESAELEMPQFIKDNKNKTIFKKFTDYLRIKYIGLKEAFGKEFSIKEEAELFYHDHPEVKITSEIYATEHKKYFDNCLKEFNEAQRVENLVDYCKNHNDNTSEYMYNEVYLKNSDFTPEIKQKLADISNKYGVRIFPNKILDSSAEDALNYIEQELDAWSKASNGTMKIPPVIDFTSAKRNYIDPESAYGNSASTGFSETFTNGSISMNSLDLNQVEYAFRHELMHTNDTKRLTDFKDGFVVKENGEINAQKCKFYDDFVALGIDKDHIPYAYNNPMEFIAVASESKLLGECSPGFKKALIEFGMPEWIFGQSNPSKNTPPNTNTGIKPASTPIASTKTTPPAAPANPKPSNNPSQRGNEHYSNTEVDFETAKLEINNLQSIEELDSYIKNLNNRTKNCSKSDKKILFENLTIKRLSLELKALLNNDEQFSAILTSCTVNGKLDKHKLNQEFNFEKAKKQINELKTVEACIEFQKTWDQKELRVAQKDILFHKLLNERLEIINLENIIPDINIRNRIINAATLPDGSIDSRVLRTEITCHEIKDHIKDSAQRNKIVEQCVDENGILDKRKLHDHINTYKLELSLENVRTKADCEYLREKVQKIDGITSKKRLELLGKIKTKEKTILDNDYELGYANDDIFDAVRAHMYPGDFVDVSSLHTHVEPNFVDYPNINMMYQQLEPTILKLQNNNTATNIYRLGQNSIRGRNIVTLPEEVFDKAQEFGLSCIIDLRDEASDNIRIKKDKISTKDGKTMIDQVEYFQMPVDHTSTACDDKTIRNLGKFFEKLEADNFYIGCANGSHRTDYAIALGYVLDNNISTFSGLKFKDASEIRPAISRIYNKIQHYIKTLNTEQLNEIGLTPDVISKLPNEQEFKEKLSHI